MSRFLKGSSGRLKHLAAGVASGAAAGFVLNPLLFPAGAIAGGYLGNKVYCENAAKEMRVKELGARFDKEAVSCAACGADKSKKGGLGNCYGCGKVYCSSCREKTFNFRVEEEDISANLKVCDSCHEELQTITMSEADLGDDGSEPSSPLYDFSSFQAASTSGTGRSAFDKAPSAAAAPASAAAPAYASGLGQVPMYASGGSFHSFNTPVHGTETPARAMQNSGLYPSVDSLPSAPTDDFGMVEIPLIPSLSAGSGGDRLERVITAASFFPDAPEDELPLCSPSAPVETGDVTREPVVVESSMSSLTLNTNSGPELMLACEEVAATASAAGTDLSAEDLAGTPADDSYSEPTGDLDAGKEEKKQWESSWDLPPAVLAQRAIEKLRRSEGEERAAPEEDVASTRDDSSTVAANAAASLFPDAPDHQFSS